LIQPHFYLIIILSDILITIGVKESKLDLIVIKTKVNNIFQPIGIYDKNAAIERIAHSQNTDNSTNFIFF